MKRLKKISRKFTTTQGRDFQVTYFSISGTSPGPVLTIISGQHGMEHSGPNLLPALIEELAETDFAGTVNICPCANPLALEMDYEFYPENEDLTRISDYYYSRFRHNYCPWGLGRDNGISMYNMNRLWNRPGAPGVAGKITHWLWEKICKMADIVIDLHCWQGDKPFIYNSFAAANDLVRCFGAEAVIMCSPKPPPDTYDLSYQAGLKPHHYTFCVEFSAQHSLKQSEYEWGRQGIRNIMAATGMTSGEIIIANPVWEIPYGSDAHSLKTEVEGHIYYYVKLFEYVEAGTRLYEIRDLQNCEIVDVGIAPISGLVGGISYQPVMKRGFSPCWIGKCNLLARPEERPPALAADFFRPEVRQKLAESLHITYS